MESGFVTVAWGEVIHHIDYKKERQSQFRHRTVNVILMMWLILSKFFMILCLILIWKQRLIVKTILYQVYAEKVSVKFLLDKWSGWVQWIDQSFPSFLNCIFLREGCGQYVSEGRVGENNWKFGLLVSKPCMFEAEGKQEQPWRLLTFRLPLSTRRFTPWTMSSCSHTMLPFHRKTPSSRP